MRIFKNAHIPFVKIRYYAYALSLLILIPGLIAIFVKGMNWSIDFTSGVAMEVNLAPLDKTVPGLHIDKLRKVLQDNGFKDVEIQSFGQTGSSNFLIKTKGTTQGTGSKIIDILAQNFPEYVKGRDLNKDVVLQIDEVGPRVGGELRRQALFAVLLSLLLMIVYIWIRFELTFGIAAILAIAHDVTCLVGIFALTGKEMTVQIIAALLTLVGYSINDTIVVYDRIREDLRIYRKDSYETVFNNAMNKTLSRTTITAGTTLISALALYFFGGSVIHDFAFAMVIGLFLGTYSSIFVASNLVVDYYHLTHQEKSSLQTLTNKVQTKKR
jgi:preprotein translocase SecF subunit